MTGSARAGAPATRLRRSRVVGTASHDPGRPRAGTASGVRVLSNPSPTGTLASFGVPSFRYQFGADLLTAWAIEMEVLLLGWFVLVETDSALLVAVLGALRFGGTLVSPPIGSMADRLPRRWMLIAIRAIFGVLAMGVMVLGLSDRLEPWHALTVAAITGVLRPADMILRQSLVADVVPRDVLVNAVGFSRATVDGARMVGPLVGSALMAAFGLGAAYILVSACYLVSTALQLGVRPRRPQAGRGPSRPIEDLREGLRYIAGSPRIAMLLGLAFSVNLTGLCLTGGLLPVVARDVYRLDEVGLGLMAATFAGGALVGSLLIATRMRSLAPERAMLGGIVVWHLFIVVFSLMQTPAYGIAAIGLVGLASSFAMVPMASSLIMAIEPRYRGRVMGVRQLAVFGLPVGLLAGGALVEVIGVAAVFGIYGVLGAGIGIVAAMRWDAVTGPGPRRASRAHQDPDPPRNP